MKWEERLEELLPFYGHRNWIVVADFAYPAQVSPGIETVLAEEDHIEIVQRVLQKVDQAPHLRALIWMDREFEFVEEDLAPGINDFRSRLEQVLRGRRIERSNHIEILRMLSEAAMNYRVFVIKTKLTLPYTSVFFELDCGYWTAEKEKTMRQRMMVGRAV